ncbi:Na(+)-translocating NADH-quinone reductase subunit C [Leptobacterium sp. I13]|uniref:Na(+)-translocating NADH-quinone reductase subunit C n=1 Tax=Leptobacterium meishanense TaxID=3128904 RepID=UPI0030EE6627
MNRDSNAYTFIFAIIMVVVVGATLAIAATSLKSRQDDNVRKEKMQNILSTIGVDVDREGAEAMYKEYVKQELSLTADGNIDEAVNAFDIDLKKELKKAPDGQRFPLYIAYVEGTRFYIVPLRGAGLWDAIWGYISLREDLNTVKGAVFDHKGETPGLGAEITQDWFEKRFVDEKIFDENGNLQGITVLKGNDDPQNKEDHEVDAISGATITGDGVTNMIKERLAHYLPYFEKEKTQLVLK